MTPRAVAALWERCHLLAFDEARSLHDSQKPNTSHPNSLQRVLLCKHQHAFDAQAWLYLNEAMDLVAERRPHLVIYQAGMDPHSNDPLSRSKMSGEFLAKRDEFVMETLLSLTIPFFFVLAGGYQEPMEEKLVPLHVRTFEIAAKLKHRAAVRSDH